MLRIAIIDDEPLARQGLRHLLANHPGLRVVGEADCKDSALRLLRQENPDAIFLDIHMPGATGFDLLGELQAPPKVVFVTAHANHAVHAFDLEAVDYLLKPVRPSRFAEAVRRVEHVCSAASGELPVPAYAADDRICLRTPQRTLVAPLATISALQADSDFTRIFLKDSPPLMICQPIGHYEKILPSPPFLRVDRSLIINLDAILRLDRTSRDSALLRLEGIPQGLPLGRTAQSRLRDHLPWGKDPRQAVPQPEKSPRDDRASR